jgi:hypothetical protein
MIALDLDKAEQKPALKTNELREKKVELATTQENVQVLSAQLDRERQHRGAMEATLEEKEAELAATQRNVQLLSTQLGQEKHSQLRVNEKLHEQETSTQTQFAGMQHKIESMIAAMEHKGVNDNGDVSRLQADVFRLTGLVTDRDEELRRREAIAGESERTLTNQLQAQRAHLEEHIRLREAVEAVLTSQQQQASAGWEMAELRRLCNFYQEKNQRLSKQIRLVTTTKG